MDHFQKLVDGFIDVVNKLAKSVEEEKLLVCELKKNEIRFF